MKHVPFHRILPNRLRGSILIITIIVAATLGGVAVAQSSESFDLACRGTLSSAGGVYPLPNNGVVLVGSLGQPAAGVSQGNFWGVKAGYVQPIGGPTVAASASTGNAEPETSLESEASGTIYLPALFTIARYVRPCNW